MSDPTRDEASLSAELSALRSALREVRAPDDELALRSAMRARAAAHSARPNPTVAGRSLVAVPRGRLARVRRPLAIAVAAAAVVAAIAVSVELLEPEHAERAARGEQAAATTRAPESPLAAHAPAAEPSPMFRPISFARGLSPAESYSVVRVRLELATAAARAGAPNAAIEADLLIGEDGLARAIRFDSADTLPVYAAARAVSGERR